MKMTLRFTHRFILTLLAVAGITFTASADDGWLVDFAKAKAQSAKEGKPILMEFTGSDWCPPCMALKKNVFNTDAFKKYAKANLVLVEFDFPKNKSKISKEQQDYNNTQKKKFGIRGYPSVYLLDANGKELLKKVGYGRGTTCDSYIKALKNAEPELPVTLDGNYACMRQFLVAVAFELNSLFEVNEIKLDLVRAAGQGKIGNHHVKKC